MAGGYIVRGFIGYSLPIILEKNLHKQKRKKKNH